jgi:transcriptional regulator with XRE-family HTH domain
MFPERLKLVRSKTKLSQQEFGNRLGVSRDVISNLEYGRVEPKEPLLSHLCAIYSISKDWLLNGNGEMSDQDVESRKNINEAVKILSTLRPELQDYAIRQIRGLAKVQSALKE